MWHLELAVIRGASLRTNLTPCGGRTWGLVLWWSSEFAKLPTSGLLFMWDNKYFYYINYSNRSSTCLKHPNWYHLKASHGSCSSQRGTGTHVSSSDRPFPATLRKQPSVSLSFISHSYWHVSLSVIIFLGILPSLQYKFPEVKGIVLATTVAPGLRTESDTKRVLNKGLWSEFFKMLIIF